MCSINAFPLSIKEEFAAETRWTFLTCKPVLNHYIFRSLNESGKCANALYCRTPINDAGSVVPVT